MAALVGPMTPQRPLPGAFVATPAPAPTIFAANAATLRQNQPPAAIEAPGRQQAVPSASPIERAARCINDTLAAEEGFPELEAYVTHGVTADYDIPTSAAWQPYQKLKMYDLPPKLLEQVAHSGVGMMMGVFPSLHHAWVALDNALYLWDYTVPNPEIIGYEENPQLITAVRLVAPKPGVFVDTIRALIVVCTATDMLLLGVATQTTQTGAQTIALYSTRMSIPVKGLAVSYIAASSRTGRIFFTGDASDDIYEFQYQQDEGWFHGKCSRICHTKSGFNFVSDNMRAVGQYFGPAPTTARLRQLVVDDTRNLLYTLSNRSEIKVWLIKDKLELSLSRSYGGMLQASFGHFDTSKFELLTRKDIGLCAISAVPATEARKVGLVASTTSGARLYISVTRGPDSQADAQNPPVTMAILHVRFPPADPNAPQPASAPGQTALAPYNAGNQSQNISTSAMQTNMAYRTSPGYWMAFQPQPYDYTKDRVFCAAPDFGRLKNPQDASPLNTRFVESGQWIDLPSQLQEVQPLSESFGAFNRPQGFGNELAIQFDRPSPEFAIVTTAGVQTIRRRRLVDIFATILKYGSSDKDGLDGDIKRFVQIYGRGETAATALAVACGQGLDVAESRVANITDPDVIEKARKAFIEYGGKAEYNANAVVDHSMAPIDSVRPSPRHEGLALYISRLVRSIWKAKIITGSAAPGAGASVAPTVKVEKLRTIQRSLLSLKEFLERNKSFIEGLAGPQALSRITNPHDELALQGEHRAMTSLTQLINSISEGISFVLVLFDERLDEILALLSEEGKNKARELTFEGLFASAAGRELAKELVKAIVNRNIANGSNVDTVSEGLRRRCGSFCSSEDVVIFKAQEQVKRASEAGSQTESGRASLNESQRLFQKVAGSLSYEHLKMAIEQYVDMAFYAGAIQLCLTVALEKDKAKRALSWQRDGKPEPDERKGAFEARASCYSLIFATILELDKATAGQQEILDGRQTIAAKRRSEAYDVLDSSDDLVFLTCLYDWYVADINQPARLLEIDNPYVIEYLRKRSQDNGTHADLLWRYFAHHNDFLQAASVQLDIARSHFELSLEERISYLSRARTNASTRQTALMDSRQSKQKILREISDLLDIATVQDELLQRIKAEPRISDQIKPKYVAELNSQILSVEDLFNRYADSGSYHDICILLYQVADHRNPADILASWQQLINQTHTEAPAIYGRQRAAWEAVGEKVREMGRRLQTSPPTFPIGALVPLLEKYRIANTERSAIPKTWTVDLFLDLEVPFETLLPVLESVYYSNEAPFLGSKRKVIAGNIVYLLRRWFVASERSGERVLFGSEENARAVQEALASLGKGDALEAAAKREAEDLVAGIGRASR